MRSCSWPRSASDRCPASRRSCCSTSASSRSCSRRPWTASTTGPLEAARASGSTGAPRSVRWAVLPQVLPNYVAFSLYAFELNIRASTVIGIVGAGGIGNVLFTQYRFFNWSNVSVIIIELFVFVFLIELLSIRLRRRLV